MKDFLQTILDNTKDIINTKFEYSQTDLLLVPNYEDNSLTFESGHTKRGKEIETCVLHVDIRNSIALSQQRSQNDMGKIYMAFTKAMIKAADYYGGTVRNIIGDRVMIVFPAKDCFTNAVNCAIMMNTIAHYVFPKAWDVKGFKCGIGIAHGKMKVIKVGLIKQGKDNTTYKNLVWIGTAANIASRLTDVANKEIERTSYYVTRNPPNPKAWRLNYSAPLFGSLIPPSERVPNEPLYLISQETKKMTPEEFANEIWQFEGACLCLKDN